MTATPLIVCVDDDVSVARALARSLKREHLSPLSTTEPEEALEWVLDNEVAVLVSDYDMPSMTGVQLASRVRELRPRTVRILMTGNPQLSTAIDGINQGEVFRFVTKPFDMAVLVSTIHQAIAHHRELVAVADERELAHRRAQGAAALEAQFPTLTMPARAHDGAYLVPPPREASVRNAGLEAILALCHPLDR